MIFYSPASTAPVREAMTADVGLGCIVTPNARNRTPPGAVWCADNGAFGGSPVAPEDWWTWLNTSPVIGAPELCEFAVAPDVVADAAATLERSLPWLDGIRDLGLPPAYVAQNGIAETEVPWDLFDVLFLGGDDDFKLGAEGRRAAAEALARGKSVHMGRVNSLKRIRYASAIGCSSVDGTIIARAPDIRLPEVLSWIVKLEGDRVAGRTGSLFPLEDVG